MIDSISQEDPGEEGDMNAVIRKLEKELEEVKGNVIIVTRPSGYKLDGLSVENSKHVLLVLKLFLDGKVSELRLASMASPEVLMKLAREYYISEVNKWNEEMKVKEEEKEYWVNSASIQKLSYSAYQRPFSSMSSRSKTLSRLKKRPVVRSESSLSYKELVESHLQPVKLLTSVYNKASSQASIRIEPQHDFKSFSEFLNHIRHSNKEESAKMKRAEEESDKLLREKGEWMRKMADIKLSLNNLQLHKENEKFKYFERVGRRYDRQGNLITFAEELQNLEVKEKMIKDNYFDAVQSYISCSNGYLTLVNEIKEEMLLLKSSYNVYLNERASQLQSIVSNFDKISRSIRSNYGKKRITSTRQ